MVGVALTALALAAHYLFPSTWRTLPLTQDPAVWGKVYPLQYRSFMLGEREVEHVAKAEKHPYITVVYAGNAFSREFNESRAHNYSLDDLLATARGRPSASCLLCKTSDVVRLIDSMGWDSFSRASFDQLAASVSHPVSCANCHDPEGMSLRVSNPALLAAVDSLGWESKLRDHDSMRSMVCAQCHVEYYFDPDSQHTIFPWKMGLTPSDIESYFENIGFADWVHPLAKVGVVKIQHPEFETFWGSVHQRIGLSCADCHMPKVVTDGKTHTSHWWTSPMNHLAESCGSCHQDMGKLAVRVETLQADVSAKLKEVGEGLANLGSTMASLPEATEGLDQARTLYARAHLRWDWVFSENSTGFHNSALAHSILDEALGYIEQARGLLQ